MEVAAPTPELTAVMDRSVVVIASASVDFLEAVARFDDDKLFEQDGATSMSSWLAARYGLARGRAREMVRVAHALRRLPAIAEAYRLGDLSWDQLAPLTRFATPDTDALWARKAVRLRPSTLWREAERRKRWEIRDVEDARRKRYLDLRPDPELPVLYLEGMLPSEEGAAVQAALERRAREVVLADQPDSPAEARLADALVEMATGTTTGEAPVRTVVVHASVELLAGQEPDPARRLAETEEGVQLPSEAIRRLTCDARIEWLLSRAGRTVGIGRQGRTVPGPMLRALRHRDEGACRFPGCGRTRWLHAHHLVHWGRGGGTDLDNLVLLCSAHHRLLHEGGWRTRSSPGNDLDFLRPTGEPLRRGPSQEFALARAGPSP
jgi:Domain of unknown function (DUF222)/HNH endonuclease